MKSIISIVLIGLIFSAQYACRSASAETTGLTFDEPENPQVISPVQDWGKLGDGVQLSWGSTNTRYHKDYIPDSFLSDTYFVYPGGVEKGKQRRSKGQATGSASLYCLKSGLRSIPVIMQYAPAIFKVLEIRFLVQNCQGYGHKVTDWFSM